MTPHSDIGRNGIARVAIRCQPDSRLVRLVREGHDLAFAEIVRRYRPQLVAYAGAIVPDHHAEDVVQEALTRAHAGLGRSDGEMNLRPWLHTIVRNGALNTLRDEPAHSHLDENYDGVLQPSEVAARREELAALTAGVKRLPDQQREALVKRELEGRSHAEIAASLGLSAGAVRGLIYRARTALRDGAGMLIPLPVLRVLDSGSASPEATGAAGAAAAGIAGGGGGIALKAGATLGVAVIAVGSGIAVQQHNGGPSKEPAGATTGPSNASGAHGADGPGRVRLADAALPRGTGSGNENHGSASSGPGGGHDGPSGSSSGSGSDGRSGGGGSSGPGPGSSGSSDGGGHSGSGSSGSSEPTGSGDDGGGPTTTGHDDGGGSSGSGGGDDVTSGSGDGGGDTSGHDGGSGSSGSGSSGSGSSGSGSSGSGSSGSGSSGSGGDDGVSGSSGSGSGEGGSTSGGSSGSGSGDDGGTTTTTTTTTGGGGTDGGGGSGGGG